MPAKAAPPPAAPDPDYDRYAIFNEQSCPLHPAFMREAVRTLMRALPIDPDEPDAWAQRRMLSALLGLAALNPRDEIEVMIAVQALCAYYAASAGWHVGMNHHRPNGDSTRHLAAAASAARLFDTMLRALERRQAKPLAAPTGRPEPRTWPHIQDIPADLDPAEWHRRCQEDIEPEPDAPLVWTDDDLALADAGREDPEPVEGVLPDGSIVMPEKPTQRQASYIAGRLSRAYRREIDASRRNGATWLPPIRGIQPGERVP
jgi:hypothetical protein